MSQSIVPGEDVGVVGAGEGLLQLLQLERGEGRAVPTLLAHLDKKQPYNKVFNQIVSFSFVRVSSESERSFERGNSSLNNQGLLNLQ